MLVDIFINAQLLCIYFASALVVYRKYRLWRGLTWPVELGFMLGQAVCTWNDRRIGK